MSKSIREQLSQKELAHGRSICRGMLAYGKSPEAILSFLQSIAFSEGNCQLVYEHAKEQAKLAEKEKKKRIRL